MSRLDTNIINNLKMLALDTIYASGSGDACLSLSAAPLFYTLFMEHLNFDRRNIEYINRDRLIVSNRLLPLMYSSLNLFYKDYSIENLKEYKKLNSNAKGYANIKNTGIDMGSIADGDVVASSVGIAVGEKYLESLIKIENPKCDLVDFKTICICTEEDIMNGISYEALSFASTLNLNKYILIVVADGISKDSSTKETFNENLIDRFISLNFNVEEVNGNNIGAIDGVLDDAYKSKKTSVIIVNTTYGIGSSRENSNMDYNKPLSKEEMNKLREEFKLTVPFEVNENYLKEIEKSLDKRLNKSIMAWQRLKEESLQDLKLKAIINFLTNGLDEISFKPENIKINDNYDEELTISNNKIFNILASKSPFVLCGSNDNFIYTKVCINKSKIMSKENPTGRNILFGGRSIAMGGIACGLASLGFKMFVSAPLTFESVMHNFIKLSVMNDLGVSFIFTQDTFLNTYENMGICPIEELNSLRMIPELIDFRPTDINEVIGLYDIISHHQNTSAIIISSNKSKKLIGTNPKYVLAGAYRVKKEKENLDAILIATGSEVPLALKVAEALEAYDIDFRVVSMPSMELFGMQKEKYQNMLLPKDVFTFTLEFGSTGIWYKYATNDKCILGIDSYGDTGTKEELLNYYGLDIDSIKVKILGILKNK